MASGGDPFVINHYDSDDRLILQEFGGTNGSGVSAGGTISYSREEVNADSDPSDLSIAREITTIVDRNQNITVMSYNVNGNLIKKEEKTRGVRDSEPQSFVTTFKYTEVGLLKKQSILKETALYVNTTKTILINFNVEIYYQ